MTRAASVTLLLLVSAAATAQENIALREGIVIDPKANVAYVMSVDGGVAAIDLKTGGTRWKSKDAAKPLAIIGDVLVSQVEPKTAAATRRLEVATLNIREGGKRMKSDAAPLPQSVRSSVGETLEGRFSAYARPIDGDAVVTWRFDPAPRVRMQARPDRSAGEPDEPADTSGDEESGVLRMDVDTARLSPIPGVPENIVAPRRQWLLFTERNVESKRDERWYESADGRHALKVERVGAPGDWQKYRWLITERQTGKTVGELRSAVSFTPFVVREDVIVYETTPYRITGAPPEPAKLRGVHLMSGKEVWAVPVRETVSRSIMPP